MRGRSNGLKDLKPNKVNLTDWANKALNRAKNKKAQQEIKYTF